MKQTVHRWLALLVAVTVAGPQLRAQSTDPEHVAQQYTEALRAGDWTHMAELMHPDALRELRILFDPLFDLPAANDALPELLGVRTLDEARALSDTGLFAGFMQFIVNQDPVTPADVDVIEGLHQIDHPARVDVETKTTKQAAEKDQVAEELASPRRVNWVGGMWQARQPLPRATSRRLERAPE